jgi:hypothetical protein
MSLAMNVEDIYWHDSGIDEILFLKEKGEIHLICEFNKVQNLGIGDGISEMVEALIVFKGVENLQLTDEINLFTKNSGIHAEVLKATFTNKEGTKIKTCDMFIIVTNFTQKPALDNYGSITFDYQETYLKLNTLPN